MRPAASHSRGDARLSDCSCDQGQTDSRYGPQAAGVHRCSSIDLPARKVHAAEHSRSTVPREALCGSCATACSKSPSFHISGPLAFAGLLETVAENGLHQVVIARRVAAHPEWRQVGLTTLPWGSRPATEIRSTNSGRVVIVHTTTGGDAPAAPLDEIVDGVAGVGVVKVEAGGLSPEILASGRRLLRRDRPLVAARRRRTGSAMRCALCSRRWATAKPSAIAGRPRGCGSWSAARSRAAARAPQDRNDSAA
jgi:hypothetical protein